MSELYLSTQEFKTFECKEEFLMGINPKHFRSIWNCTDWTDTIVMSVDEGCRSQPGRKVLEDADLPSEVRPCRALEGVGGEER